MLTITWAGGLKARGHTTEVAYGFSGARLPQLHELDIDGIRLSDRLLRTDSLLKWILALRRVTRVLRPDVVYAQSITCALIAAVAAPRLPLLVTVHGIDEDDQRRAALVLRATAARVTAVSGASALGIGRHRMAPRVEVVWPGVDLDRIAADAAAEIETPAAGAPQFCCVARHHPAKGVDVLIRAFAQVRRTLPDATLTLVGTGVAFDENVKLAADLGLEDAVHFTGLLVNPAPHIRRADVSVLPSRREGLPVFALESFALGRPLVATAVGGTPSIVADGETGWLVAPEDPEALARAMVEAGSDLDEARARGKAGMQFVAESFTVTKTLDRIERLLEELVRDGRKRYVQRPRAATPPVKPRSYYLAGRAHQWTRIAHARTVRRSREWQGVRILGYHRVAPADDVLAVGPDSFRAQMETVRGAGATPVSLDSALDLLAQPVTGRYVCITFDDGFADVLDNAVPILRELEIPATLFVASGVISREATYDWYRQPPPALTWEEIRRLVKHPLFDVQAHSRTHRRLPALSEADARAEIAGSKLDIERRTGQPVTSFCYPAGLYGQREVRLVEAAGYRAAVTTRCGLNRGGGPRGALHRTMIMWRDTLADFEAKMDGLLDNESMVAEWLHRRRSRGDTSRTEIGAA